MASRKGFWITAALVTAAIVLPFGSVLLVAGVAARKRKALKKQETPEQPYAAWYRLREDLADRKN